MSSYSKLNIGERLDAFNDISIIDAFNDKEIDIVKSIEFPKRYRKHFVFCFGSHINIFSYYPTVLSQKNFKCDQFDGLIDCINHLVKTEFIDINK